MTSRVFLTTAVDAQGTEQPEEGFYLGKDRGGRVYLVYVNEEDAHIPSFLVALGLGGMVTDDGLPNPPDVVSAPWSPGSCLKAPTCWLCASARST